MNLVALVLILVLTTILASAEGARGAAMATAAGELALALMGGFLVLRRTDLQIVLRPLALIGAAAVIAAAPALLPGIPDAARAALASVLFVALLLLFRAFPEELLVELRRRRSADPG
jgi:hypothetical protein